MDRHLHMELRRVEASERLVVGVCVPYDEVTYLVFDPTGNGFGGARSLAPFSTASRRCRFYVPTTRVS